jgi:tetratricopeptide (TPR) repeat protein
LAHHLCQSGSAAELTKTVQYLELAADAALASGAPEEALAACERALGLDENDEAGRKAWLLFKRGTARRAIGEWKGAASDWEEALPFFEQAGEGVIVSQICYDIGYNCLWEGGLADALKIVERGLKTVGEETSAAHCRLLAIAATAHEMDDEFVRGLELSDRAVAMAEVLGDDRLLGGEVLFGRMFLLAEHMMLTDMQDVIERAIELTTRSGSPWDLSSVLGLAQMDLPGSVRFAGAKAGRDRSPFGSRGQSWELVLRHAGEVRPRGCTRAP